MLLDSSSVKEAFEVYRQMDWPVIAVRPGKKIPAFTKWTGNYWPNMNQNYISKNRNANIGLLLGKIIDVEADSEEAEQKLNLILSGIPHLHYRSSRGSHHLFINRQTKFRKLVFDGIEYRGSGHHSLLPPSIGPTGFKYKWAEDSTDYITPLPEFLEKNITKINKRTVKMELPRCHKCGKECKIASQRFNLEIKALNLISIKWQCHSCRKYDLRPICRLIRKGKEFSEKDIIYT